MTTSRTDQEIADWLTEHARQGQFTVGDVRGFSVLGRAEVCAWIDEEKMRAEWLRKAEADWLRAFSVGDGRDALRSTDPGARRG